MKKIAAKKIEDYEVGQLFFNVYRHLAKPDDEGDQPRLTRSSTPMLVAQPGRSAKSLHQFDCATCSVDK